MPIFYGLVNVFTIFCKGDRRPTIFEIFYIFTNAHISINPL